MTAALLRPSPQASATFTDVRGIPGTCMDLEDAGNRGEGRMR